MSALRRVLAKLARQGDFSVAPLKNKQPTASSDAATDQYQMWLYDKYQRFVQILLASLQHSDARLQVAGLHSLMDLVALDCETRAHPEHRLGSHTPNHTSPLPAFSSELFWPVVMRVWAHPGMSDLVPHVSHLVFFQRVQSHRGRMYNSNDATRTIAPCLVHGHQKISARTFLKTRMVHSSGVCVREPSGAS